MGIGGHDRHERDPVPSPILRGERIYCVLQTDLLKVTLELFLTEHTRWWTGSRHGTQGPLWILQKAHKKTNNTSEQNEKQA